MATDDALDRESDPFRPPPVSTLVHCLHCGQEYDSYRIEWRVSTDNTGRPHGFWCCPVPGCGGAGFGCDIFPVDPDYRDEEGHKMWCSDDEDEGGPEDADAGWQSDVDPPLDDKGGDESLPA